MFSYKVGLRDFNSTRKTDFFQHQHEKQVKMYIYLFLFHDWFGVCICIQYFFDVVRNILQTINTCTKVLELIKRRSKVQEKNIS